MCLWLITLFPTYVLENGSIGFEPCRILDPTGTIQKNMYLLHLKEEVSGPHDIFGPIISIRRWTANAYQVTASCYPSYRPIRTVPQACPPSSGLFTVTARVLDLTFPGGGGLFGSHRFRKASKDQVYEHARWRRKRTSEAIDKQYQAWPLRNRIMITLTCH